MQGFCQRSTLTTSHACLLQVHFGPAICTDLPASSSIFHIEPASLQLAPGASGQVAISFSPRDARTYPAEVPLFLGPAGAQAAAAAGAAAGRNSRPNSSASVARSGSAGGAAVPYMHLELQGLGLFAALTFDVRECVLPPVPLGKSASGVELCRRCWCSMQVAGAC